MTESEERAYEEGERRMCLHLLVEIRKHLGEEDKTVANLIAERHEAIAQLRQLCEEFGDNDWEDDLHLGDVIEKHLGRRLWHEFSLDEDKEGRRCDTQIEGALQDESP